MALWTRWIELGVNPAQKTGRQRRARSSRGGLRSRVSRERTTTTATFYEPRHEIRGHPKDSCTIASSRHRLFARSALALFEMVRLFAQRVNIARTTFISTNSRLGEFSGEYTARLIPPAATFASSPRISYVARDHASRRSRRARGIRNERLWCASNRRESRKLEERRQRFAE